MSSGVVAGGVAGGSGVFGRVFCGVVGAVCGVAGVPLGCPPVAGVMGGGIGSTGVIGAAVGGFDPTGGTGCWPPTIGVSGFCVGGAAGACVGVCKGEFGTSDFDGGGTFGGTGAGVAPGVDFGGALA